MKYTVLKSIMETGKTSVQANYANCLKTQAKATSTTKQATERISKMNVLQKTKVATSNNPATTAVKATSYNPATTAAKASKNTTAPKGIVAQKGTAATAATKTNATNSNPATLTEMNDKTKNASQTNKIALEIEKNLQNIREASKEEQWTTVLPRKNTKSDKKTSNSASAETPPRDHKRKREEKSPNTESPEMKSKDKKPKHQEDNKKSQNERPEEKETQIDQEEQQGSHTTIIRIVKKSGTTTPSALPEKELRRIIEDKAGKGTTRPARYNKLDQNVTMKITGTSEKLKEFLEQVKEKKMELKIAENQVFQILNIEKREPQKFTILAPYYDDKEITKLQQDIEEENEIKIYKIKKLDNVRHSVYMVTMHYSQTKRVHEILLNGKSKQIRTITNLKKCHKCNATSHTTIQCCKEDLACFKCGVTGHKIANCPNNPICQDCKGPHRTGDAKCKQVIEKIRKLQIIKQAQEARELRQIANIIKERRNTEKSSAEKGNTQLKNVKVNEEERQREEFKINEIDVEITQLRERNEKLEQQNEALKKQQEEMATKQKRMEQQIANLTKGQQQQEKKPKENTREENNDTEKILQDLTRKMEEKMQEIVNKVHKKYEEAVADIFKLGATSTASLEHVTELIKTGINRETNFDYDNTESECSSEYEYSDTD